MKNQSILYDASVVCIVVVVVVELTSGGILLSQFSAARSQLKRIPRGGDKILARVRVCVCVLPLDALMQNTFIIRPLRTRLALWSL